MKRKGQETMSSGTTSVVVGSPANENQSSDNDAPSSFSVLSPRTSNFQTWEETRESMAKVLRQFEGTNASNDVAILKENSNVMNQLESNLQYLKTKSSRIKDQIQEQIQNCAQQFQDESNSLQLQQQRVGEVTNEIDRIRRKTSELVGKEKELKTKIEHYKDQASQEVEQIDEVEEEKKAEVFRLQQHISLLALVSGIKWDYDCIDSIAGEVEIPSKRKHIRFEIDREEHCPFEIANILWGKIGA